MRNCPPTETQTPPVTSPRSYARVELPEAWDAAARTKAGVTRHRVTLNVWSLVAWAHSLYGRALELEAQT
jgi:hypothetical protein